LKESGLPLTKGKIIPMARMSLADSGAEGREKYTINPKHWVDTLLASTLDQCAVVE